METSEQDVSTFRLILVSMRVLFCLVFKIVKHSMVKAIVRIFGGALKKKEKEEFR
jgi:hypothetical protein